VGRLGRAVLEQPSASNQSPLPHTGIPLIVVSIALLVVALFVPRFWPIPLGLFVLGWILQFVGHAFEGKAPEFFHDWRFLFVGLRWWMAKVRGRLS